MVKGMIKGVADLHNQNMYHWNLTSGCFFITFDGHKFIVKLDDLALGDDGIKKLLGKYLIFS